MNEKEDKNKKIQILIKKLSDMGVGFNRIPYNVLDKRDGTMAIVDYARNEIGWITTEAWEELGNEWRKKNKTSWK